MTSRTPLQFKQNEEQSTTVYYSDRFYTAVQIRIQTQRVWRKVCIHIVDNRPFRSRFAKRYDRPFQSRRNWCCWVPGRMNNGSVFDWKWMRRSIYWKETHEAEKSKSYLGIRSCGKGHVTMYFPYRPPRYTVYGSPRGCTSTSTTSMKSCLLWKDPIHFVLSGRLLLTPRDRTHLQSILICVAL